MNEHHPIKVTLKHKKLGIIQQQTKKKTQEKST